MPLLVARGGAPGGRHGFRPAHDLRHLSCGAVQSMRAGVPGSETLARRLRPNPSPSVLPSPRPCAFVACRPYQTPRMDPPPRHLVPRPPAGARILEVGCGGGYHLDVLRALPRRDWGLEGVEPNTAAADRARGAGFVVRDGRLQDLPLPDESCDGVLLMDALEHLDDPVGTLQAVSRILRPEGRVLVIASNARSAAAAVFRGRHWSGYDFPRHRHIFDRETFRRLAETAGLEVTSLRSAGAPDVWVASVRNALDDWGAPSWLSRRSGQHSFPALGLATLVEALQQRRGKGGLLIGTLRRAPAGG